MKHDEQNNKHTYKKVQKSIRKDGNKTLAMLKMKNFLTSKHKNNIRKYGRMIIRDNSTVCPI